VAPRARARGVAVFDLDGTVTWHDTLVPYLLHALAEHPRRVARLWTLPATLAGFVVDRDRGRLKSRLIRAALGGLGRDEVARLTRGFLDARQAGLVRPAALAAIARHRAAGDWLVLLSASTDFYVCELGARLGFDEVICTEVRWQGDRLDGALLTANRRGAEKTRCLEALRARHPGARITAYANAASDLEHLARADAALLVNGAAGTCRKARRLGLECGRWN
jgi:HAD superfamily phosphoserine phosphatase-like hydrolase